MAGNRKPSKGISSGRPRSYSDLYRNSRDGVSVTATENGETAGVGVSASTRNINWGRDYGYVVDDLRRLGIVTGVLVIAMIVVGFVL